MKPQRYEETVTVDFQGTPLRVSLIVESYLDEDYREEIDGMMATQRTEYAFVSTFVDQPPRTFTADELKSIVTQAQAAFIRQRAQWI